MDQRSVESDVRDALARWDASFAAWEASPLADLFSEDAQLLLLYADAVVGRAAIREEWAGFFREYDTSAWEITYDIVAGCEDLAVSLGIYTETLRQKATGQRTIVRGRAVYVWRREDEGLWRIIRAVNSHSAQPESVA